MDMTDPAAWRHSRMTQPVVPRDMDRQLVAGAVAALVGAVLGIAGFLALVLGVLA